LKKGFSYDHWDLILKALQAGEEAFYQFATTDVIRHVVETKKLVNYTTMQPSPENNTNMK
jgi:hypothetical protein